jgi:putative protease
MTSDQSNYRHNHKHCQPPEILAPVGDEEALLGAIKGAADAVYLGVEDFNARKGARNFSLDKLEEAIDLAHSRGVRVFLALNIPIKQKELQTALDVVDKAYSWGIDAIILEDLGLMRMLSRAYPELPLHVSTQMTIHNPDGVAFAEEAGASRVIVSRELTAEQVKDIVDKSNIDIEIFVHGALCYSYSGRCLFSSFLSDRSANRGACTQPCRRQYHLTIDGKAVDKDLFGEYPISCAELCTLPELDRIVKTGIKSLKIEGRMKKPEYVTASSEAYKAAVERICSTGRNLDPEEIEAFETDLAKLFYRGFTRGFVSGERDVTHQKYSSSYGLLLGRVKEVSRSKHHAGLRIKLLQDINDKDGIGILTSMRMLGCRVDAIISAGEKVEKGAKGDEVILEISPKTGKAVRVQDEVFLSTDNRLIAALQKKKLRTVPATLRVFARLGENLRIEMEEARGGVSFTDGFTVPEAKSSPTTAEQISATMEKLGETPYHAGSLEVIADGNIFIPVGVLNNARRQAVSLLQQTVLSSYKKELKKPLAERLAPEVAGTIKSPAHEKSSAGARKKLLLSVDVSGPESLFIAANAGADIIYVPMECFSELTNAVNSLQLGELRSRGTEIVFVTPQVSFDHELESVRRGMENIGRAGFVAACSNAGTVRVASRMGLPFVAQRELNVFNAVTAGAYFGHGARRVTLSTELNMEEIRDLSRALDDGKGQKQMEVLAYGRELLLITENDLLKPLIDSKLLNRDSKVALEDNRGDAFPVMRLGNRTLIYHSRVLDMREHLEEFRESGVDVLRLDLSMNNKKEVREIIRAYRSALEGKRSRPLRKDENITQGHYFEGVL